MNESRMRGATLIELVIAIVIIGMAGATIVGLMTAISRRSAEALVQSQSSSIADAYLREIQSQRWTDPNGVGGEARGGFDNIDDYGGLNETPTDRAGNVLANLAGYNVAVSITQPGLGVAPNAIPNAQTRLIRITVTNSLGSSTTVLSGFRTQPP